MSKCEFKVGDKVRIKKDCEKIKGFQGGFEPCMKKYEGEICEIERLMHNDAAAIVTGNVFTWDVRAFEPVNNKSEINKPEADDLDRYIINDGATILFWADGTKTIVKRTKEDEFNPRLAFLTAYFQKKSGLSKTKANKFLSELKVQEPKEKKVKKAIGIKLTGIQLEEASDLMAVVEKEKKPREVREERETEE